MEALQIIHVSHGSPEWLAYRQNGIGGSDAAAILGVSPFKTNVQLWEEKIGLRKPADISDKEQVKYGRAAEDLLVQLFALDYPQYKVNIDKTTVYQRGFMFASLDGELYDVTNKEFGIYEGKTAEVHSKAALAKWDRQIPEYYYVQILHYFLVTQRSFAVCKAQLKTVGANGEVELITRHFFFFRKDLEEELAYLYAEEKKFWQCVEQKKRPALILPAIEK